MAEAGPTAVAASADADSRVRTLTHDFGAVRPVAPQAHTFRIANPTAGPWTLDQFRATCGCTVADISADVIPPGGSAEVRFGYTPPAEPADDRRSIDAVFKEPAAPLVRLVVAARVRHPLTVFPVRLRLPRLPHGRPHVERVTVENYSGEELPPPKLAGSRDWMSVGTPELLPAAEPGLRQKWGVPVTVAADRLAPGDHAGEVAAAEGQPHAAGLKLPVTVQVVPPLDPTPGQLFFGTAPVGKPTTVTFAVRLPAAIAADTMTLAHDLGPQMTAARTAAEPGKAHFTATLTPAAAGMLRGTLSVRCGDPAVPPDHAGRAGPGGDRCPVTCWRTCSPWPG